MRRLGAHALASVLALAALTGAEAQGGATATVEVRVWLAVIWKITFDDGE